MPIVKFVETKSGIAFDIRFSFVFSFSHTNSPCIFIFIFFFARLPLCVIHTLFCSSFDIDGGPQAADFIKVPVQMKQLTSPLWNTARTLLKLTYGR